MTDTIIPEGWTRQTHWRDGLYQDHDGRFVSALGHVDRDTLDWYVAWVGRNDGPALLDDLVNIRKVDLTDPAMAGVVASVWSLAAYPQRSLDADTWTDYFRDNGYTHDGQTEDPPTQPIELFRGCHPDARFGMSWTADLEIARRFAYDGLRGRTVGHVYVCRVWPTGLLAYIGPNIGRDESEYVIDGGYLEMYAEDVHLLETVRP